MISRRRFGAVCTSALGGALFALGGASTTLAEDINLTFVTGSTGGGYFKAAAAFAEYISKEMPEIKTTVLPGAGWANIDRLETGDADLAVVENVLATLAAKGDSPTGRKYDFKMLAAFRGPSVAQAIIPVDRGVTSFEQIAAEKLPLRIATFERAHIVTPIATDILAEYGITEEALTSWGGRIIYTSLNEGFRMVNDGVADMWLSGGSFYPHHAAIELGTKEEFTLLPISEEVAKAVSAKYGAQVAEVPAGIYEDANGTSALYYSPSLIVAFAVRSDLDEELVYKLTATLWKYREDFRAVHNQHMVYDLEFAAKNVGDAPLHPGAARWYKEQGVE